MQEINKKYSFDAQPYAHAEHLQEIADSRIGGFGGSDAKFFSELAMKLTPATAGDYQKTISKTALKRIAVAKEIVPFKNNTNNRYMLLGRAFEDYVGDVFHELKREYRLENEKSSKYKTFAHADIYNENTGEVIELKCTKMKAKDAAFIYRNQLQWYYFMGAKSVMLVTFNTSNFTDNEIDEFLKVADDKFYRNEFFGNYFDINNDLIWLTRIEKSTQYQNNFKKAVKILDEIWDNFEFDDNVVFENELSDEDIFYFNQYIKVKNLIEKLEERANELKEDIMPNFEARDFKRINVNGYSFDFKKGTTRRTFDSKKAIAVHPELDGEEFYKVSESAPTFSMRKDK